MALTIGTGFIVDDAIVMIENIVRNMENGQTPLQAAFTGAREIGFTVISLTVSLIAVFIPLLFMTGLVGPHVPRICADAVDCRRRVGVRVVDADADDVWSSSEGAEARRRGRARGRGSDGLDDGLLRPHAALGGRPRIPDAGVAAGTLALTLWMYVVAPKGFLPLQDNGLLDVVVEAGPDASFAQMTRIQNQVSRSFRRDPDVLGVVSVLGIGQLNATANVGHLAVTLKPRDERTATAADTATG